MIITLSPAKILDFKSPVSIKESSQPLFVKKAHELNDILKDLSREDISDLMKINPKQTMDVYQYIHSFDLAKTPKKQAAFAYNGIAYQGLEPETLTTNDFDFAQKHLLILSGLYGVLRPLDIIKPYRLELQSPLDNPKGKTLYNYWSDTITQYMSKQLLADDNIWVNLSSNEYTKAVDRKKLPKGCRIITPLFKEHDGNKYKQVIVYAKKARGMMARFIVQNKLTDIEHLKAFDTEGYSFAPQLSSDKEWIFIR
ncbi:peroxide stress protein YaaA [Dysgonomonas sp. ZJ279]|uniref:peroxide stress protein YaaA n=1 Tax=Dysgonomonas sp. ZJ279 TaxID=2709796 RepID=UPI0013EDC3EE|nr:peroxide stress protein YaaA [Dysgonomonas sp. ZJ279]